MAAVILKSRRLGNGPFEEMEGSRILPLPAMFFLHTGLSGARLPGIVPLKRSPNGDWKSELEEYAHALSA